METLAQEVLNGDRTLNVDIVEIHRQNVLSLRGIQHSLETLRSQVTGYSSSQRLNDQELRRLLNWVLSLPEGTDEL